MKPYRYLFIYYFIFFAFTIFGSTSKSRPVFADSSHITSKINSVVTDTTLQKFIARQLGIILSPRSDQETWLSQQKIILLLNNNQFGSPDFFRAEDIFPVISSPEAIISFVFNYNKETPAKSHYRVNWIKDSSEVTLLFPADIQLITGMDKIELDSAFYSLISSLPGKNIPYVTTLSQELIKKLAGESGKIMQNPGTDFFGYTNTTYFYKNENGINPVRSAGYTSQTIANYLQGYISLPSGISLNLEQRQYQGGKAAGKVLLSALLATFSKDHIILSAQDEGADSMLTTILFYNPNFSYIHLCYFYFPLEESLKNIPIAVPAKIYSYIRLDNVNEFFRQYEEKDPQFKVKVEED